MTLAYFDCFAGAGGDMIVGSLLDAGCDFDALRAELEKLGLGQTGLRLERVQRGGLSGSKFTVDVPDTPQPQRHLHHIVEMIEGADLPARAADRARAIFQRLAEAEASVHDTTPEKVHFHEVGAIDSIMDIVGAAVALELLGIDRIVSSPIPLGSGTIVCDHGEMPVPAPATSLLLRGVATVPGGNPGEMTTPTAAAILATLADDFAGPPAMNVAAVGYGAGTRDNGPIPNLLRVFVGSPSDESTVDTVVELSANIDDCSGEVLGAAIDALLAAGCLDAFATPAAMKKSRPAWVLSAICEPADVHRAEQILFAETTTLGIRRRTCHRSKLERSFATVETPYGPVRVKLGSREGKVLSASPEFADCIAAAKSHHASLREVQAAAVEAWRTSKLSRE